MAKGDIPFVGAIIGQWKYGIGGGVESGPRLSIFRNTREKIEIMKIKVFTTGESLDIGIFHPGSVVSGYKSKRDNWLRISSISGV